MKIHSDYTSPSLLFLKPLLGLMIYLVASNLYAADALLAWSEKGDGGYNVYFSEHKTGSWSNPKRLSNSTNLEILPTLSADSSGKTWVAWTEMTGSRGKLKFRQGRDNDWGDAQAINTGNLNDTAASLLVDAYDVAWIIWSGVKQGDDDIYVARWQDGGWSEPLQINLDDESPDILPTLSLSDSGNPQATWYGYTDGSYVEFSSEFNGDSWSTEQATGNPMPENATAETSNTKGKSNNTSSLNAVTEMPELPHFLKDMKHASLHLRNRPRPVTMRLRNIPSNN